MRKTNFVLPFCSIVFCKFLQLLYSLIGPFQYSCLALYPSICFYNFLVVFMRFQVLAQNLLFIPGFSLLKLRVLTLVRMQDSNFLGYFIWVSFEFLCLRCGFSFFSKLITVCLEFSYRHFIRDPTNSQEESYQQVNSMQNWKSFTNP